ncbi:hypothetical protein AKJ16_DCAP14787 [Drosera capensis]
MWLDLRPSSDSNHNLNSMETEIKLEPIKKPTLDPTREEIFKNSKGLPERERTYLLKLGKCSKPSRSSIRFSCPSGDG